MILPELITRQVYYTGCFHYNRHRKRSNENINSSDSYIKELVPELLERQGTGSQEHESNFGILRLDGRGPQNLPDHSLG